MRFKFYIDSLIVILVAGLRIVVGFVIYKAVAKLSGAEAVALTGQVNSVFSITQFLATGAIATGIIKYCSQYRDNQQQKNDYINTGLTLSVICSAIIALIFIFFKNFWAAKLHIPDSESFIIYLIPIASFLFAINSILIAIINGSGNLKQYSSITLLNTIIGTLFAIVVIYFFKIKGALVAIIFFQAIVVFQTAISIYATQPTFFKQLKWGINKTKLVNLLKFSAYAIVNIITVNITLIMVRNFITQKLSLHDAGIWESMTKISVGLISIYTMAVGSYFFPLVANSTSKPAIVSALKKTFLLYCGSHILICLLLFTFRTSVTEILYSKDFGDMNQMYLLNFIGDVFRLAGWVTMNIFIAKNKLIVIIIYEVLFQFVIYTASLHFFFNNSLQSVSLAYCITYLLYFICTTFIFIYFHLYKSKSLYE